MAITTLKEIPSKAMKSLVEAMQKYEPTFVEFDSMEDIVQFIREGGRSKKSVEYDYINYAYTYEVGEWIFEAYGSCYIKDSCICDEDMADCISITSKADIQNEKQAKEREKQLAKVFAKETSDKNWDDFFSRIESELLSNDEILTELKKYKFPTEQL
jgi:hypothetical protein